jgi:purine-binding chemotaxis protein CheW
MGQVPISMHGKYVVFRMGQERFGVPIAAVERILPSQSLTKIPRSPKALVGMFPYQGSTVAVIDAATRFELPKVEENQHFLVIATPVGKYGIQVEAVETIVEYEANEIDAAEDWLESIERDMAFGVGKKSENLCLLLKPEAVVPSDLKKKIDQIAA